MAEESNSHEHLANTVTFCVIEPTTPFIYDVRGAFTIEALNDIEAQFTEEPPDYPTEAWAITYECRWFSGQYGEFSRCEIEPHWELAQVGISYSSDVA